MVGTGFIDHDEFCSLVRAKMQEDEDERELKEIFRVLDKDKRGEVRTSSQLGKEESVPIVIPLYSSCPNTMNIMNTMISLTCITVVRIYIVKELVMMIHLLYLRLLVNINSVLKFWIFWKWNPIKIKELVLHILVWSSSKILSWSKHYR